ncbi:FeoA domain-containing protein [Roseibium sp. M-1]
MSDSVLHASTNAQGFAETRPKPEAAALTLAAAVPGRAYHVTSLGTSRQSQLELLSTGLAPDTVLQLLRGAGQRPRIVAYGENRAAIGADLACDVCLQPCGTNCGCPRPVEAN